MPSNELRKKQHLARGRCEGRHKCVKILFACCYATVAIAFEGELQIGVRREVCLLLDFKINVIKQKLHFVSCNFCLQIGLVINLCDLCGCAIL